MSITNDFVPFATGAGANVPTQVSYLANPDLPIGNQPGIASSSLNNKALRQGTYVVSQIAQYIANTINANVTDDDTPSQLLAQIALAFRPVGEITMWPVATAPTGWHAIDGTAISRTTYPVLFALMGTTFGIGDGSTTFNLPNLAGLFPRMLGTQTLSGIVHAAASLGTAQNDQFQGHVHLNTPGIGTSGPNSVAGFANGATNFLYGNDTGVPDSDGTNGTPRTGIETRPANLGLNFIIKLG